MREVATREWIDVCKGDFNIFTEDVLGFDNAPHQTEWCKTLGNEIFRKLIVAAPRGHSKTTVFSVNYPLWRIAQNPNIRILLVSAADTQSQSFLREIKGRIERDQTYVDFAGQLKPAQPEKWTDKEIILKRSRTDLKDPTISTVSVEGTILSKRADEIICDDLLNFENTRTPEQRQKIWDWFNLVLLPVLEPGGRLIVAGTIWQVDDLMEALLRDPTFDYRKKYQAILEESKHPELWQEWCNLLLEERDDRKQRAMEFLNANRDLMYEGVKVLWPERRPYEDLYMLRYSDPYAFARAYQNDPASRPSQKIKREWIDRALERGRALKLQDGPYTEYLDLTTEGLDLAISQDSMSDDTCKLTLDKLQYDWQGKKKGSYIVRQIKRGKMTPGETRSLVATDFYAIRAHGIRVESVQYQEALVRDLNDTGIPVHGHRTGSEKWDSAVGVNSIALLLEHDMLTLPSDPHDARTKELIGKLVAEMLAFPEGHTGDSLMALWFAVLEMTELTGTRYTIPRATAEVVQTETPPMAPQHTPQRQEQEKQVDQQVIAQQELQRGRQAYWKNEERRVMNASAKRAFRR